MVNFIWIRTFNLYLQFTTNDIFSLDSYSSLLGNSRLLKMVQSFEELDLHGVYSEGEHQFSSDLSLLLVGFQHTMCEQLPRKKFVLRCNVQVQEV